MLLQNERLLMVTVHAAAHVHTAKLCTLFSCCPRGLSHEGDNEQHMP